jgi:hypothetical protein
MFLLLYFLFELLQFQLQHVQYLQHHQFEYVQLLNRRKHSDPIFGST